MLLKNIILTPLSWVFAGLVAFKNALFDCGLRQAKRLPRPVISVGNLAMGGTGKSPVVHTLVGQLLARGLRVAVLSRGYGRLEPERSRKVDAHGDWRYFGDEPMMLARAHPQAEILVGPSRYEAAQLLAHDWPDIFVVDDGFQHRQLARDLDIVLIDTSQPEPHLFPRGLFRESWSALKRADVVLLTRCGSRDLEPWRARIAAHAADVVIVASDFVPDKLCLLHSGRTLELNEIPGARVAAYAAIAQPDKFRLTLENLGLNVLVWQPLPDHGILDEATRNKLFDAMRSQGLRYLLTTEKDAVKLELSVDSDILLCSLPLIVSLRSGDLMTCVIDRVNEVAP